MYSDNICTVETTSICHDKKIRELFISIVAFGLQIQYCIQEHGLACRNALRCMHRVWIVVLDLFTHNVDILFTDNLACLVWVMIFNTGHLISLDIGDSVGGWYFFQKNCVGIYSQVADKTGVNVFV